MANSLQPMARTEPKATSDIQCASVYILLKAVIPANQKNIILLVQNYLKIGKKNLFYQLILLSKWISINQIDG